MPEAGRGGLADHLMGERCKFGPFTFGGGRNFPFSETTDAAAAGNPHVGKKSQRQYMQGKRRDRIGGSTTHMDGELRIFFWRRLRGGGEGGDFFFLRSDVPPYFLFVGDGGGVEPQVKRIGQLLLLLVMVVVLSFK